jgi:hypothetical protein
MIYLSQALIVTSGMFLFTFLVLVDKPIAATVIIAASLFGRFMVHTPEVQIQFVDLPQPEVKP